MPSTASLLSEVLVVIAVLLGPETKGKRFTSDLEVFEVAPKPAT